MSTHFASTSSVRPVSVILIVDKDGFKEEDTLSLARSGLEKHDIRHFTILGDGVSSLEQTELRNKIQQHFTSPESGEDVTIFIAVNDREKCEEILGSICDAQISMVGYNSSTAAKSSIFISLPNPDKLLSNTVTAFSNGTSITTAAIGSDCPLEIEPVLRSWEQSHTVDLSADSTLRHILLQNSNRLAPFRQYSLGARGGHLIEHSRQISDCFANRCGQGQILNNQGMTLVMNELSLLGISKTEILDAMTCLSQTTSPNDISLPDLRLVWLICDVLEQGRRAG